MEIAEPTRGRRPLLRPLFGILVLLGATATRAALPEGAAPPALGFRHFPDRQHAFVWRNWNLVEPARLAKVLGTSESHVAALAASMGLPPAARVSPHWRDRGYITLVRRNWHLLPYDQLLDLLDIPADRLEYLLREDDFLFVKLGNLKPKCDRLAYAAPDGRAAARAAEIKRLVAAHFGDEMKRPEEPRFAFLERFTKPVPRPRPAAPSESVRFAYSYSAVYGDPLSDPSLDPFPEGLLQELADRGVNGVWVHTVLRDLAPGGEAFPEFGRGHEARLEGLRRLVDRAARFGVSVYLYVNEPRAMPAEFFASRPEMAGAREGGHVAMCTSDPRVRGWVTDALAHVFAAVPGLGGAFTITASENLTSCASHFRHKDCPRCAGRSGAEVVAEVNRAVAEGVRRGSASARVIAWDWGWPDDWAGPAVNALPKDVWLMSVSEWSLPLERGGVRTAVGEYSLSAVGPGPRASRHWRLGKAAGLRTAAKVQLNNTWELSAVPWLPVADLVAEHCDNLRSAGVDGMMLSWTLGGYPSPNLELAHLMGASDVSRDEALDALARRRYGDAAAPGARRAWTLFSDAFRHYPYDGSVVYHCPVQYGPSNLLYPRPTGYSATMVGFPYDDLDRWRGPYPPEVFAAQFEKLSRGWEAGVAEMAKVADVAGDRAAVAKEDLALARVAGLHFRSVANQARFVMARNAGGPTGAVVRDEIEAARQLFDLARQDSRIGFEASNHYYYVPQDLIEKVINCADLADGATAN